MTLLPLAAVFTLAAGRVCAAGPAADSTPDPASQRLVNLCKVWGTVKFFNPVLACRNLDWDTPLISAIPKVKAATSASEYAAAVQDMLSALNDPVTRVLRSSPPHDPESPGEARAGDFLEWLPGETLVLHASRYRGIDPAVNDQTITELRTALVKAHAVVLDLRGARPDSFLQTAAFASELVNGEIMAATNRYVRHVGYALYGGPQQFLYFATHETCPADPTAAAPGPRPSRLAIAFDGESRLSLDVVGLRANEGVRFAGTGPIPTEGIVDKTSIKLEEGFVAQLRTGEIELLDGTSDLEPDVRVPALGPGDNLMTAALALARGTIPNTPRKRTPLPLYAHRQDDPYSVSPCPSPELRLLGLFRFWNVIRYFYGYPDSLPKNWDAELSQSLGAFERADTETKYVLATAKLAARIPDSNVHVYSGALNRHFGEADPPFHVRMIEGLPCVADLVSPAACKEAGVSPGDVIVTVAGAPVQTRMAELAQYLPASNPWARDRDVCGYLLSGPDGTSVQVTLRDARGRSRAAQIARKTNWPRAYAEGQPAYRLLPGNIGYVDLQTLRWDEVDPMYDLLVRTRAILFDIRHGMQMDPQALVTRLNRRSATWGEILRKPVVRWFDEDHAVREESHDPILTAGGPTYPGQSVLLVDEFVQGTRERFANFLRAAGGTKFVGTRTAGACGNVSNLVLPGGIVVQFGMYEALQADGAPLQRIGLPLDVEVKRTLQGVREGRDQILEAALARYKAK